MRTRVWRVHSSRLPHSRPVFVSSRSFRRHVGKSVPSQSKRECLECPCLIINDSHTRVWMSTFVHYQRFSHRVWMSTFVRTSSRSHLAKSLDEYPRHECKPGIRGASFIYFFDYGVLSRFHPPEIRSCTLHSRQSSFTHISFNFISYIFKIRSLWLILAPFSQLSIPQSF